MKKLLFFLSVLGQAGFAQTHRIDSLKRALVRLEKWPDGHVRDTLRHQTLRAVMNAYADVNVDSSVRYNSALIKLCTDANLRNELIYAYQFAGYLYQIKGDHYQSIRFYYQALPLAETLKQYSRMASSHGGLAHAYTSLNDYRRARQHCETGLAILRNHPDADTQLPILNALGVIYREQGQLKAALTVNRAMYKLAQTVGNLWYEAHGLHAIGLVYTERGDMTQALAYYQKALPLSRQTGSIELEGNILINIADLYIRQKNWPAALRYANLAKQTAVRVNHSGIAREVDEKLHIIFKNTGKTAEALNAYEHFVLLKDSLLKNERRIEDLEARYDNIQKDNELQRQQVQLLTQQNENKQLAQARNGLFGGVAFVALLAALLFWNNRRLQVKNYEIDRQRRLLETARQQLADSNRTLETRVEERTAALVSANRELIRKNEEIKGALLKGQTLERKRVAIELHDNLSSLLSAVNMSIQSINPRNLSESEQSVYRNVKQLIQNAYAEVRNISHNILPAELEREGLARTLTTLIGQLNQNSPLQFVLTITGLSQRLPVEIEFNVYSIVLELMNNAIKHANATTVSISLRRTDSGIDVFIADDGIGMGQLPGGRGVGLQNIQTRLDALGGTLDIQQSAKAGTHMAIKIPVETVRATGMET